MSTCLSLWPKSYLSFCGYLQDSTSTSTTTHDLVEDAKSVLKNVVDLGESLLVGVGISPSLKSEISQVIYDTKGLMKTLDGYPPLKTAIKVCCL